MALKFETKQILITIKAYPNPSKKYVETVCAAGIDLKQNKWIRLYPVPFRDLELKKKFKKYDIIQADVMKAPDDSRLESYKINSDTISVIDSLGTTDGWKARKKHILPLRDKSMCEIERKCKEKGISLGLFKPHRKVKLSCDSVPDKWKPGTELQYAQLTLFNAQKKILYKIPYIFRLKYLCQNEPECKGHNQCVIDWEIGESFRSWKRRYKTDDKTIQMIKKKWQDQMFEEKRDTYLFVGNQHRFKTFMILGIFWPPKI